MKRLLIPVLALCGVLAAQPQCTIGTVRGTYAVSYASGWALMPQQGSALPLALPGVILGVVSIGYDGTLSGGETVIIAGQAKEYDINGKVEINSDCTGTLRILTKEKGVSAGPAMPVLERFVAVAGQGQEFELQTIIMPMPASPVGAMSVGTWKRMTAAPGTAGW